MSDEKKPTTKPEKGMPGDATPSDPGISDAPRDTGRATTPDDKTPYEKTRILRGSLVKTVYAAGPEASGGVSTRTCAPG